jgi:hypothetical protein
MKTGQKLSWPHIPLLCLLLKLLQSKCQRQVKKKYNLTKVSSTHDFKRIKAIAQMCFDFASIREAY